jgi:hypothetical protein
VLPSTRAQNTWGRLRDSREYPPPATLALSLSSTRSNDKNDHDKKRNADFENRQHNRLYLLVI